MCFSGRMSHLGLDTLWCLKHILKCDTPSTYLLAVHNNPGACCWSERAPFRRIYRVWYGVEAPRWHGFVKQSDTVYSLILIPLTLPPLFCHLPSEKWGADRNGVCLLLFHFWLWFSVLIAFHFFGTLCCCFFFVVFISQVIQLIWEPIYTPVSLCIHPNAPTDRRSFRLHQEERCEERCWFRLAAVRPFVPWYWLT